MCERWDIGQVCMRTTAQRLLCTVAIWSLVVGSASAGDGSGRPFGREIDAFLKVDAIEGLTRCGSVFVGSSSIRMWRGLSSDMVGRRVVRRGIGGARLSDVVRNFEELIARHRPRTIVLYAGENDIAGGRTPADVVGELDKLMAIKREALGRTPVHFISIKPSPRRWRQFAAQSRANALIEALADAHDDLVFVDVVGAMLEDGRPKRIFLPDGLHMNRDGYRLWAKAVTQALDAPGAPPVLQCQRVE